MAKQQVWQRHHITYEPDLIVKVTRGEHFLITQLQRFKSLSQGARQALLYEISQKPDRITTLENDTN